MMCAPDRTKELLDRIRHGDEWAAPELCQCLHSPLHWAAVKVGYSPVEHIETEL